MTRISSFDCECQARRVTSDTMIIIIIIYKMGNLMTVAYDVWPKYYII